MRKFIEETVRSAGEISVREAHVFQKNEILAKNKSGKDIVTELDRKIESFIISKIRERWPDHGVYGEESGISQANSEYRWVIDPIDGTNSLVHGQLYYSVSIAFQKNGETLCGGVFAPRIQELFFAEKGHGAFLNNVPIRVSTRSKLIETIVGTGFACVRAGLPRNTLGVLNAMIPQVRDMRRMGSAALDLCYVACGRFDGFYEMGLNLYDVAAGELIVREAGGRVSDFEDGTDYPRSGILASNGILHPAYLGILHENY